jgi:NAD(P)-dependent dehydrogenase (short-subunit alcohol dehydrogenase family)
MPGKDKFVLVTGAYGGMGRATALALRDLGYTVFAMDRTTGEAEDGIIPITADFTDKDSICAAYETVRSACNGLYAIIHYAGIYMLDSLVEMSGDDFERIFRINLFGAFYVNRTFLPLLSAGSRILITTSELAPLDPLPFTGIYAISKAALDKYAYSLAMELQLLGIRVSVLRAGATQTDMLGASTSALDAFCAGTRRYTFGSEKFRDIVNRVEARCIPGSRVAQFAASIIEKKRPAFAYSINRNPLLLLLGILPCRLQLWIIGRILK